MFGFLKTKKDVSDVTDEKIRVLKSMMEHGKTIYVTIRGYRSGYTREDTVSFKITPETEYSATLGENGKYIRMCFFGEKTLLPCIDKLNADRWEISER